MERDERREESEWRAESGSYQYPRPDWGKGTKGFKTPMHLPLAPFPGASGLEFKACSMLAFQILEWKQETWRGCRHPACSSPCSALGEKQKRVGSTETRILQKGFLPAVHVSATLPLSPSSQMCSHKGSPSARGEMQAGSHQGWSNQECSHSPSSVSL